MMNKMKVYIKIAIEICFSAVSAGICFNFANSLFEDLKNPIILLIMVLVIYTIGWINIKGLIYIIENDCKWCDLKPTKKGVIILIWFIMSFAVHLMINSFYYR